jgi:hypothetical protein
MVVCIVPLLFSPGGDIPFVFSYLWRKEIVGINAAVEVFSLAS